MCPPSRLFRWQSLVGICLVSGLMMAAWPSAVLAKIDIQQNSGVVAGDPTDGLGYMDNDGGGGGSEYIIFEDKTYEDEIFAPGIGREIPTPHFLFGSVWFVPAPAGYFLPIAQFGTRQFDRVASPWLLQGVLTP